MIDVLHREFIYLWYYFSIQFHQIFKYWLVGMSIGSIISVFGKEHIHSMFQNLQNKRIGIFGILLASLLGIASPLCMYGTIPIADSLSAKGMADDWLAAFMMSSILLNPQLIIYSAALGMKVLIVRIITCLLCGIIAGGIVHFCNKKSSFFNFTSISEIKSRDTDPNILLRLLKNFIRNIKATGLYFLFGILLSALFQRYVPTDAFVKLFGTNQGFGVLMAATVGVPLYLCGGGTIPLLQQWLSEGMSMGSAAAFMITGPGTKITNLGAVKIVLGNRQFIFYLLYIIIFSYLAGLLIDISLALFPL